MEQKNISNKERILIQTKTEVENEIHNLWIDLLEYEGLILSSKKQTSEDIKVNRLRRELHFLLYKKGLYKSEKDEYLSIIERAGISNKLSKTKVVRLPINHIPEKAIGEPIIEKKIKSFFKNLFLDTGLAEIQMTQKIISKEAFDFEAYDNHYVRRILKINLELKQAERKTFSYPHFENGKWYDKKDRGRPFVFPREKFITGTEGKLCVL